MAADGYPRLNVSDGKLVNEILRLAQIAATAGNSQFVLNYYDDEGNHEDKIGVNSVVGQGEIFQALLNASARNGKIATMLGRSE